MIIIMRLIKELRGIGAGEKGDTKGICGANRFFSVRKSKPRTIFQKHLSKNLLKLNYI